MHPAYSIIENKSKALSAIAVAVVFGFLLLFPLRLLIGDWYSSRVVTMLDDRTTEERDVVALTEASLPLYLEAEVILRKAAELMPLNAQYQKAVADMDGKLARWVEVMGHLKAPVPAVAPAAAGMYEQAGRLLQRAIELDPTNADYHLAMAQFAREQEQNSTTMDRELKRAAASYPINSNLRLAIAMQYLLAGRTADALEQARTLAAIDDGYIYPASPGKSQIIASRPPWYVARLANSNLCRAYEIAWRATNGDAMVIRDMTPNVPEAHHAMALFLEGKGIEE